MGITVLFFGATADIAGKRRQEIEAPEGELASNVFDSILAAYPRLTDHKLHLSVNQQFAMGDEVVRDGDEIAIFTTVSGG